MVPPLAVHRFPQNFAIVLFTSKGTKISTIKNFHDKKGRLMHPNIYIYILVFPSITTLLWAKGKRIYMYTDIGIPFNYQPFSGLKVNEYLCIQILVFPSITIPSLG